MKKHQNQCFYLPFNEKSLKYGKNWRDLDYRDWKTKRLFRIFVKLWQSVKNKYSSQTYNSRTTKGSC